nr:glucose and ribitol dehydrogenase homolog 1-like [Ipomoea batatas]
MRNADPSSVLNRRTVSVRPSLPSVLGHNFPSSEPQLPQNNRQSISSAQFRKNHIKTKTTFSSSAALVLKSREPSAMRKSGVPNERSPFALPFQPKQDNAEHAPISHGPCLPLIPITDHEDAEFLATPIAQFQQRDSPMGNGAHSNKDSPQQIHTQTDSPHTVSHDISHEPQDNPTSQPVDSSPLSTDRSDESVPAHDNDRGQCTTAPPLQPRRSTRQRQLVDRGIRVNGVAPGPIWTPLIPASFSEDECAKFGKEVPMQRAGQTIEVAPSYVFLASCPESSYITGQILHPNGGTIVNG